ncbi:MAG: S8 family peptidase, partial [Ignavibacteriales bacterium]
MLKNFRKIHPIIILTTYILVSSYALPQVIVSTQDKNGASSTKNYPSGIVITSFMRNDSTIETSVLDPNENIQVIVKFREDPLILQRQRAALNSNLSLLQIQGELISEHASFKNDLLIIETKSSPGVNRLNKSSASQIRFEYYSVFNGVSLTTKRWVAEEVKRLSYVQSVYEDKEVKAFDDISNRVIGADIVWKMKGLTGKGIKIGILDTGIDYMHPDLGGGFGPDFKVAGGYDFVNMDNDPRDDNGHGTHVAGIVSANGYSLKGVAPDSKLWAFKVLNNGGSGLTSTIIAGIERASDPDQNPKTDDGVDIINMSLGGVGDPEDPISQAVDNASLAGIVCVVAAGNNGAYQTIGSPGCARKAITVGATSNDDIITNFSSCGPANKLFNIKPDLTAPGVSIYSSINGGGYLSLDGTSMATPHVAGCAALLLQLHPDWNPELIKAVLMESAKYTGNDIWKYGTGRVDVNKAVSQNTVVTPASISLG